MSPLSKWVATKANPCERSSKERGRTEERVGNFLDKSRMTFLASK